MYIKNCPRIGRKIIFKFFSIFIGLNQQLCGKFKHLGGNIQTCQSWLFKVSFLFLFSLFFLVIFAVFLKKFHKRLCNFCYLFENVSQKALSFLWSFFSEFSIFIFFIFLVIFYYFFKKFHKRLCHFCCLFGVSFLFFYPYFFLVIFCLFET